MHYLIGIDSSLDGDALVKLTPARRRNVLRRWLREQGFWYWWTRNDLEPLGSAATEQDDEPVMPPSPATIDPPVSPF